MRQKRKKRKQLFLQADGTLIVRKNSYAEIIRRKDVSYVHSNFS
jgi:hypothetical protein